MITQTELKEYLHYDPDTGYFTWLKKPNKKIYLGSRAGTIHKNGYRQISFKGKNYPEHRLVWLYVYGNFPKAKHIIDHINHKRDDNRLTNLREITIAENNRNASKNKNTHIGEQGIWYCKRRKRYIAEIQFNGKKVFQKSFTDINQAILQRKTKLLELGFHENHGD